MILWHQAQFALWGHPEMLERSLSWYFKAEAECPQDSRATGIQGSALDEDDRSLGRRGTFQDVGSFLIWQQPHLIYLAELLYRANPTPATLAEICTAWSMKPLNLWATLLIMTSRTTAISFVVV